MIVRILREGGPDAEKTELAGTVRVHAGARRLVRLVLCSFVVFVAASVAGCSNQGSSNGQTSHCGNSNYSPAGLTSPQNRPSRECLPPGK